MLPFHSRAEIDPPPPANSNLPGAVTTLLYNGSTFQGHQKSKGHKYNVDVVLQVMLLLMYSYTVDNHLEHKGIT